MNQVDFPIKPSYFTDSGRAFCGDSFELIDYFEDNSIDLVMTSPPFALLRKKEYGNKDQDEYIAYLFFFSGIAIESYLKNRAW